MLYIHFVLYIPFLFKHQGTYSETSFVGIIFAEMGSANSHPQADNGQRRPVLWVDLLSWDIIEKLKKKEKNL